MNPLWLSSLLSLFGNLFRIYLISKFLGVFFVVEGGKKRLLFRYALYALFFIINSLGFLYFYWKPTVILFSNLIGVFLVTLTYEGKWPYRIFSTIIIIALFAVCEDYIYRLMVRLRIEHIQIVTIATCDLLLLVIILLIQKASDLRHGEDISTLDWIGVIFVPAISMGISVVAFDKCQDEAAITIGGIGLLALNILVFYLFDHLTKMHRKQTRFIALESQNQAYQRQLTLLAQSEQRLVAFRHDLNNHFATLQLLSEQEDNKKVQQYLKQMKRFVKSEGFFVATGNPLVDGMLNLKLGEAKTRLRAEVECEVQMQKGRTIDDIDMSILLGNLLDNALQALEKVSRSKRLRFIMEERQGMLLIHAKNNHREMIVERDGRIITTKPRKEDHGIGLKNVKRIVEKYNGILQIDYDEQWFSIEVLLFFKQGE